MIKRIENVFSEVTGIPNPDFTPKTKISKIPGLSSLGIINLVCALEDEFNIEIPNAQVKKFKTIKDVINYIENNAQ